MTRETIVLIAKKELRERSQDRRLLWAAILFFGMFAGASLLGRQRYLEESTAGQAFASAERKQWLNQANGTPHGAAHHGVYLFHPIPAASAIEPGVSQWTGAVVFLEAHSHNAFLFPAARDLGPTHRLGELSLASLLEVGLALLIVLLAYDAIAAERESGALRLMMAQGVSPGTITAGKFLGILATLTVVLLPAVACAAAIFWGVLPWNIPAVLAATYGAYLLQIVAIVLTISALARTTKIALLGALAFWLWNCALVPQAAINIASHLWPTPNPLEVRAAVIEEQSKHPTLWERREVLNRRYLEAYGVTSILDLPVNPDGILLLEQEEYDTRATGGNVKRVYDNHRQQDHQYRWAALAAPSVGVQSLSRAIAGTDLDTFQEFADAAEQYRQRMVRMMNETTAYDHSIRTGTIHPRAEVLNVTAGTELWQKLPPFEYQPSTLRIRLRRSSWMIASSALWLFASGAALTFAIRRLLRSAA